MTAASPPASSRRGATSVPFTAEKTKEILDRFYRDGFVLIPDVLTPEEIETFKAGIDRVMTDPKMKESHNIYGDVVAVRLFETDNAFRDFLVREPIISLAEAVLGRSCHLMAQNAVRSPPGTSIDEFHTDNDAELGVEFPLPPEVPRHDPRIRMPALRMTVQVMLTDCDSLEYGPTDYVPGSHYSGRKPDDLKNPTFEGRGPVSVLCKAGDIYLHHGMCWHRGSTNRSDRTRYLLQNHYCQRWVAQRFYPFIDYRMPPHVWQGAGERLQRVLGRHPKGPYG